MAQGCLPLIVSVGRLGARCIVWGNVCYQPNADREAAVPLATRRGHPLLPNGLTSPPQLI